MGDCIRRANNDERALKAAAAVATGEVWCLADGRAAYHDALEAAASGDRVGFRTEGICTVTKTASVVITDGQPVYWDHSANAATFRPVSDKDFFLGTAVGDAASADTTMAVNLNVWPNYARDLLRGDGMVGGGFQSVLVGTAAAAGFGYPVNLGGSLILELTATNEAQKVDALGVDGFAIGSNWIFEGAFRVLSDGGAGSQDFTLGVASATHASDFQSVAEFAAIHLDGNDTNIYCESDDGTTDVAPTDSTTDYVEGTAIANRVHVVIDGRDHTNIKFYVNGVRVLSGTTFTLTAGSATLFLIAHLEKAVGTDTYKIAIDQAALRIMEQDNPQLVAL